jgi:predicted DCC family thiol-disulfide oxidoreductase YuxK
MRPRAPVGRLTVLYDARCRVCTRIAARLVGLDTQGRLRLRSLQAAALDSRPEVRGLAETRGLRRSLHVIDEDGDWTAGGDAMLRIFEVLPSLRAAARFGRLPGVRRLIEPGYRWFARNRARLSWLAGSFRAT